MIRGIKLRAFLPIIVAWAIIAGIGVAVLYTQVIANGDDGPQSTISEFNARRIAKSAYYTIDQTVSLAVCDALGWDKSTDVWQIECTLDRENGTERTLWDIDPDGQAHLRNTVLDEG